MGVQALSSHFTLIVDGHCGATRMESHKEGLKQWSDVTQFYLHRPPGLLSRDGEAIAVLPVALEVAGPGLRPLLSSLLCVFVLPGTGGSHQFSQELV